MCFTLSTRPARSRPASFVFGSFQRRSTGSGRPEADGVVDRRGSADAAALEDREVEVLRLLHHPVGVQLADHPDLVVVEAPRLDVAAALQHEHLEPVLRQLVGDDGAARAAADDADVGVERRVSLRNLHVEVERLAELVLVGHARLEALVAHGVVGPRVVVVAGEGELLADPDARPQHVPRHRRPARQLAEAPPRGRRAGHRARAPTAARPAAGERRQLHPVQRQPVHPAPVRGDLPDVGLDVVGHVAGRDRLRPAGDEHVGHRLERPVGARPEEAERVALPPRLPVGEEQDDPEDQGDAAPPSRARARISTSPSKIGREPDGRDQVERAGPRPTGTAR